MPTNVNTTSAAAASTLGPANRQDRHIHPDFAVVGLLALFGLPLTALATAFSHGPEIAAALTLAGY